MGSLKREREEDDAGRKREELLSMEQEEALSSALAGKSMFITGSAGTGKSYLLRTVIKTLESQWPGKVYVCAPTGLAAFNVGGTTIHSYAGIGLGKEPKEVLLKRVAAKVEYAMRWKSTRVLVVDEVSMMDRELFEKLDFIAKGLRQSPRPFGGIQLVLSGDFFQLPPVGLGRGAQFCFHSDVWKEAIQTTVMLTQVFRQAEKDFVGALDHLRRGRVDPWFGAALLKKQEDWKEEAGNRVWGPLELRPTSLFAMNVDVDKMNKTHLDKLIFAGASPLTYEARDWVSRPHLLKVLENTNVPGILTVCVGAQVIALRNTDEFFNGSRGVVVGFGLDLQGETVPKVQFKHLPGVDTLVSRFSWDIHEGKLKVASRKQIPLRLAWALTIHKSQGMTIDSLEVDLGNVWEFGQAYVAISRAASMDGLQVRSFNPHGVKAHPDVVKFYEPSS